MAGGSFSFCGDTEPAWKERRHLHHNMVGAVLSTEKRVKVILIRGKLGPQASWRVYSHSGIFGRKKSSQQEGEFALRSLKGENWRQLWLVRATGWEGGPISVPNLCPEPTPPGESQTARGPSGRPELRFSALWGVVASPSGGEFAETPGLDS